MTAIVTQAGALNLTALIVPNVYVQIIPPSVNYFNGLPTNIVGVVGTAQWGPVNVPTTIGSTAGYAQKFGAVMNRKYDMGTHVAIAVQQGANNFVCVRVSDGTDAAATASISSVAASTETATLAGSIVAADILTIIATGGTITGSPVSIAYTVPTPATGVTLATIALAMAALVNANVNLVAAGISASANGAVITLLYPTSLTVAWSKTISPGAETITLAAGAASTIFGVMFNSLYTGTLGSLTQVTISAGSSSTSTVLTYKVTIAMPGVQEVFDNIGGTGNAFWVNLASAINNGQTSIRGPSQLITATVGTSAVAPTLATTALTGGTDGATPSTAGGTVTAATLVGIDTIPRKGMYALRAQGTSVSWLADADDNTQWASQVAFALSELVYMIGTGPIGDTISNAVSTKQTAGIDSPWFKLMFGDWVYWSDAANGVLRLTSPQAYIGGLLGNLSPQNSTLNKQLQAIVGTQKTNSNTGTNGAYPNADLQLLIGSGIDVIANPCPGGSYFGAQSGHNSSSDATRNTDPYTRMTNFLSLSLGAGAGKFVGKLQTAPQQLRAKAAITSFLQSCASAGQIGNSLGTIPYNVVLPGAASTPSTISLGYEICDVQVQYFNIVEKFVMNFQGGGSVTIATVPNQN